MVSSVFLRAMPVLNYLLEITKHDVMKNEGVLSDVNRTRFNGEIKSMLESAFFDVYLSGIQQKLKATIVIELLWVLGHSLVTVFQTQWYAVLYLDDMIRAPLFSSLLHHQFNTLQ